MESIKHKMDTMVKEKDAAIEKAMGFEAETEELNKVSYNLKLFHPCLGWIPRISKFSSLDSIVI